MGTSIDQTDQISWSQTVFMPEVNSKTGKSSFGRASTIIVSGSFFIKTFSTAAVFFRRIQILGVFIIIQQSVEFEGHNMLNQFVPA